MACREIAGAREKAGASVKGSFRPEPSDRERAALRRKWNQTSRAPGIGLWANKRERQTMPGRARKGPSGRQKWNPLAPLGHHCALRRPSLPAESYKQASCRAAALRAAYAAAKPPSGCLAFRASPGSSRRRAPSICCRYGPAPFLDREAVPMRWIVCLKSVPRPRGATHAVASAARAPLLGRPSATKQWWAVTGSNRRPYRCKRYALPAELTAQSMRVITRARRRGQG